MILTIRCLKNGPHYDKAWWTDHMTQASANSKSSTTRSIKSHGRSQWPMSWWIDISIKLVLRTFGQNGLSSKPRRARTWTRSKSRNYWANQAGITPKFTYHNNLGDSCLEDGKLCPELGRTSGFESCLTSARISCFDGLAILSRPWAGYLK